MVVLKVNLNIYKRCFFLLRAKSTIFFNWKRVIVTTHLPSSGKSKKFCLLLYRKVKGENCTFKQIVLQMYS